MALTDKESKAVKLKRRALDNREGADMQERARLMYLAYIQRHGINDADVNVNGNKRLLAFRNDDEFFVLTNVIMAVDPYAKYTKETGGLVVDLDNDDYKEVGERYRYFVKVWRVERELLVRAFAQKHKKYFTPSDYEFAKADRVNKSLNKSLNHDYTASSDHQKRLQEAESRFNSQFKNLESINSLDIVEVEIFNRDRVYEMMRILLDSDYKSDVTKIT